MRRKIFSILLSVAMVMVMMPSMAFAAEGQAEPQNKTITVSDYEGLKNALTEAAGANSGDTVISITENIDATDKTWTPIYINGYNGAGIITIQGNNNKIIGLNDILFSGGFAGKCGLVIEDLTIESANITKTLDTQTGVGVFIGMVDSMPTITLENCHLIKSNIEVTGDAWVGGLIGYTSGYNNPNDGPVDTHITVENCSVEGCDIKTLKGSIGGIIGHSGGNPATYQIISHCKVTDTQLTTTDDGWRVGVVAGTAGVGQLTIENITESGTTLTQNGAAAPEGQSKLYGRFKPQSGNGVLLVEGNLISGSVIDNTPVVAKTGDRFYTTLEEAINAADSGDTVTLVADVNVSSTLNVEKKITIDGNGKKLYTDNEIFAGHLMLITSDATIKNIVLDSCKYAKGVQVYTNSGSVVADFEKVQFINSKGSGLTVNGTTVNLKDVIFSGNSWQDVNVDSGVGVTSDSVLSIGTGCSFAHETAQITSDGQKDENGKYNNGIYGKVVLADSSKDLVEKEVEVSAGSGETMYTYTKKFWTVVDKPVIITPPTPVEKDPVSNEGTAGTDDATTNADITDKVTTSEGKTEAVVDQDIADKIVDKAVENKSTEVIVEATTAAGTSDASQVALPESTVKAIAEKTDAALTIKTDNAEVTLDKEAVSAVADQAGTTGTVKLVVETVENTDEKVVVELKIETSNGYVSDFKGGNVSVTVPVAKDMADKKVVCVYIDDNGIYHKVDGTMNEAGTHYTFTTGHFSTYAIMSEEEADAVIKDQTATAEKAAIKNVKTTVTLSTKNVKKGIRVTVKVPVDQKADKTGIILYRSTSKNAKPYAVYKKVATKGSTYIIRNLYNVKGNRLVKGKTYYYKARAYKVIDGKTYYGPMSTVKYIKAK